MQKVPTDAGPAKQKFRINTIFDVLTSADTVKAAQQPQRDGLEAKDRGNTGRPDRYDQPAEEGTMNSPARELTASKAKSTFDPDIRTLPDRNSAANMQEASELADEHVKVHPPAEADLVSRPINVELKTNRAGNGNVNSKQEQQLHPKSAAAARKYSEFNTRPKTNNTMRQNMVSHTRFRVHEAVGLVDPNSLNE